MKYLRLRQWYTNEEVARILLNDLAQKTPDIYVQEEHFGKWHGTVYYMIRSHRSSKDIIQRISLSERHGQNFIALKYSIIEE